MRSLVAELARRWAAEALRQQLGKLRRGDGEGDAVRHQPPQSLALLGKISLERMIGGPFNYCR